MLTSRDLLARGHERSFRPFEILTSDGQIFPVPHPDMMIVGRTTVQVGFSADQSSRAFDQDAEIAILHITALRTVPIRSGGNGSVR